MTQRTSDPKALYQQSPILIETLAEHVHSSTEDVAALLVDEAQTRGGDEKALLTVINDFITV